MYIAIGAYEKDGKTEYGCVEFKGRTFWKTKSIAAKHAADYKAEFLRDAWAQEWTAASFSFRHIVKGVAR